MKEYILTVIVSIFVVLGIALPFINADFGVDASTVNTGGFTEDIGQDDVTALEVVFSLFSMFFWTFGALPFWLDGLFLIPRIMLAVIIFQLIRGS
ncbi:MAG: hypothetical protein GTO02_13540 [Candidatus Dadabacteria bacterium]|nr:hypothetical protein [Candidatus Dadabacteria bacterium]